MAATPNDQVLDSNSFLQKAGECQKNLLNLMNTISERGSIFNLPLPYESYKMANKKLKDNTYQVIVVGEAKRGKSSFVNALIGKALLPTDVDISTAKVFRIRKASKEVFQLRFEDGSSREITQDQLFLYGSQKSLDQNASLGNEVDNSSLRWIEVDTPTKFLPDDICILDTPGTGALYAAHAEITQRFIPLADAVIFVLDSEQPILEEELRFLDQILHVTPNIFFVQTKIDRFDTESWQSVLDRNEKILEKKVNDWIEKNIVDPEQRKGFAISTKIWPISSEGMSKAANVPEAYQATMLNISRFPEMQNALKAFLYRVAGWTRTVQAALETKNYFQTSSNILMSRLTSVINSESNSSKNVEEIREKELSIQQQLLSEEEKIKKFSAELSLQADAIRRNMAQIFLVRDRVWDELRNKIYAASKEREFDELEQSIPMEVTRIANDQWLSLYGSYEQMIGNFRASMQKDLNDIYGDLCPCNGNGSIENHSDISMSGWEILKGGYRDYMVAGAILGVAGAIITAPIMPVIIVVGLVWAFVRGWKSSRKQLIQKNQSVLFRFFDETISAVRSQFFDVDVKAGQKRNMVDEYLQTRQTIVMNDIIAEFNQKKDELRKEVQNMIAQQKMDQSDREKTVKESRERMTEWSGYGKQLDKVAEVLQSLDVQLKEAVKA
jgi:GTPase SAR1 family protein